MWGDVLHGSGTWPVESGLTLRWVGMVGWVCDINVKNGVPGGELRDWGWMVSILWQGRLQLHGRRAYVARGCDNVWVKGVWSVDHSRWS